MAMASNKGTLKHLIGNFDPKKNCGLLGPRPKGHTQMCSISSQAPAGLDLGSGRTGGAWQQRSLARRSEVPLCLSPVLGKIGKI